MFLHVAVVPFFSYYIVLHLYILFHSLPGRHFGCFYFGDINNAEVNIFLYLLVHIILAFLFSMCLRENFLSQRI